VDAGEDLAKNHWKIHWDMASGNTLFRSPVQKFRRRFEVSCADLRVLIGHQP
jgi:hypothetical protein